MDSVFHNKCTHSRSANGLLTFPFNLCTGILKGLSTPGKVCKQICALLAKAVSPMDWPSSCSPPLRLKIIASYPN
eukprot:scaffold111267_cov18-Tisochrysis_lutea.AAC.1